MVKGRPKIVVVGSANTDMVVQTERLPQLGETVLGGRFTTAAGGKGANQAVAAARLGAEVTFVARLGDDELGARALAGYAAEGINGRFITRDPAQPSGVALIMVGAGGENMICVAPGANYTLTPALVEQAAPAVATADLLLVQLEIPLESVAAALRLARRHAVRIMLNPAPAQSLPKELLQGVVMTPNEIEAAMLAGLEAPPAQLVEELLAQGVGLVALTLGARGALLADADGTRPVAPFPVTAVDTTAAGDAFNGALAVALARGLSPDAAARYACAAAALATTRLGAQPSLPRSAEVEALV